MSLIEDLHNILREVTQTLSGETVTLIHRTSGISIEIQNAVVAISPPVSVSIGTKRAESSGVLRLPAAQLQAAREANTVNVRGQLWHILAVGKPFAGWVRCEISTEEQDHTNIFDLNDTQTVWHEEE